MSVSDSWVLERKFHWNRVNFLLLIINIYKTLMFDRNMRVQKEELECAEVGVERGGLAALKLLIKIHIRSAAV